MLTRKQHELLMFINKFNQDTGCSPSFEEMKEALQLKSKSGIHRLISALEERGFLARRHHRARALEVLKLPNEGAARPLAEPPKEAGGFVPNVIHGDFRKALAGVRPANDATAVSLPLYGRIAAGVAIQANADETDFIDVPASMLGNGEYFALEVNGQSMRDAGILDGDTVIIRRGEVAENGDIVVALVDENDVTLKRLRRHGRTIALEPANPEFKTQIHPADRVQVQGKLIALFRHY